ncbi:2-amino-4-hydroxy-6-hydroxymethyldihydropteridine diphosphokinase [Rhodobacter sp. NTK016B]|uniref:2-amino-4-hydroxy-6- hydroxymethyldihydropteridine diphosphokinase n=1 Tax=Rhodobacter sp. NTK016B TaxID=2759676 RepID=UPI001A8C87F9|nr:2-amino-4-hydroxy-6-hydroxymethyldihydropteridine diphosphokinase [Rhodobacter sp. NTK016B]MBN8292883.1 2-amino-4-hydroxy-6-hydroxymethyldihydropteridine diphosphokinase [Rhodobacter sp. NTK016B]
MDKILASVHRNLHLLALGSNASDESSANTAVLNRSVHTFNSLKDVTLRCSHLYVTPAFPPGAGPDFVNACMAVESPHTAEEMLALCHRIEAEMGRVRKKRWGQRVIDIDLLATGDTVLPDRETLRHWMELPLARQMEEAPDQLILPHPRLHERGFVLVPLADVAPDWVHPVLGLSVTQMRDRLDPEEIAAIRPI